MQSPLSHSSQCLLLKTIDVESIKQRWKNELGIDWLPDPGLSELTYWRDESSGLQFYFPGYAAGDSSLYSQLQHFGWYYIDNKWEFAAAINLLNSFAPGVRVLEVGSGKGSFLEKARNSGFQIMGLELNPDGAREATKKGLTVIEKDLSELSVSQSNLWDAICAFQVLEHLSHPGTFLDQAIALLKPGGLLILSVPNAAVVRELDPEQLDLLDQPPHHMSHWDAQVFQSLEKFLPLKLVSVLYEPLASYHVGWFADAWARRTLNKIHIPYGRSALRRLLYFIFHCSLWLGLRQLVRGHTLLVCLEKLS